MELELSTKWNRAHTKGDHLATGKRQRYETIAKRDRTLDEGHPIASAKLAAFGVGQPGASRTHAWVPCQRQIYPAVSRAPPPCLLAPESPSTFGDVVLQFIIAHAFRLLAPSSTTASWPGRWFLWALGQWVLWPRFMPRDEVTKSSCTSFEGVCKLVDISNTPNTSRPSRSNHCPAQLHKVHQLGHI